MKKQLHSLLVSAVFLVLFTNLSNAQTPPLVFSGWDFSSPQVQIAILALEDIPSSSVFFITDHTYQSTNSQFFGSRRDDNDIFLEITTQSDGLERGQVVVITIDTETDFGYSIRGGNLEVKGNGVKFSDFSFDQSENLFLTDGGAISFVRGGILNNIHCVLNISPDPIEDINNPNASSDPDHIDALVIDLNPEVGSNYLAVDFKDSERPDATLEDLQNIDNWILSETSIELSSTPFFAPLPVELVRFEAIQNNAGVLLSWETASEINNEGFEIEKSTNGLNWETITFIPGAGNTIQTQQYSYLDDQLTSGQYFYRLKQMDFDGQVEYSDVVVINWDDEADFQISLYPNPTVDQLNIRSNVASEDILVEIFNTNGQLLFNNQLAQPSIDVSQLSQGTYFAKVATSNTQKVLRFIKN